MVGGTGLYIQSVLDGYYLINVPVNEELRKELKDKSPEELGEILKAIKPGQHNESDLAQRKRTVRAIEIAQYYKTHPVEDKQYPKIKSIIFGIKYDWYNRRKRITERLKSRLEAGLVEEVKELLRTVSADDLIYYGLEYKYVTLFVLGRLTYGEMFEQLNVAIHQLAKRQMTWYRRMERSDHKIWWLEAGLTMEKTLGQAFEILDRNGQSHLIKDDR